MLKAMADSLIAHIEQDSDSESDTEYESSTEQEEKYLDLPPPPILARQETIMPPIVIDSDVDTPPPSPSKNGSYSKLS